MLTDQRTDKIVLITMDDDQQPYTVPPPPEERMRHICISIFSEHLPLFHMYM